MSIDKRPDVILIRHGYNTGNAGERTPNFAEIPLTEIGRDQAHRVADNILRRYGSASVGQIVTTPYLRTQQTAQPLVGRTGIKPRSFPELREITYLQRSKADGTTFAERSALRKEFWEESLKDPSYVDEGEQDVDSLRSFLQRIHFSLDRLASMAANETEGIVAVYSHEFPVSTAANISLGKSDEEIIGDMYRTQKPNPAIRNTQAIGLALVDGKLVVENDTDLDLFPESAR